MYVLQLWRMKWHKLEGILRTGHIAEPVSAAADEWTTKSVDMMVFSYTRLLTWIAKEKKIYICRLNQENMEARELVHPVLSNGGRR